MARFQVDASILRRIFNEGGYWARIQSGGLVLDPAYDKRHLLRNPQPFQGPPGTFSVYARYTDPSDPSFQVDVHFFLRPDGALGGSGLPDPKRIAQGGMILTVDP